MANVVVPLFALCWIITSSYGLNHTINDTGKFTTATTANNNLSKVANQTEKRDELPNFHETPENSSKKDGQGIPQAMTPLRVVATSAVIKDRLSKPRQPPKPVKAIHVWGATPFKTVVNNLADMNNRITQNQKRLFLPFENTPPLQQFGVQESPQILNSPKPEDFLIPENQLTAKGPDIGPKLPPLIQENERFKETPSFSDFPMMLAGANYDQITPQQAGLEQFVKPQDVFFNRYSQFNQQAMPQQLLGRAIEQKVHHHHHKGSSKAKCTPNPCLNDGVCTAFSNDYECTCPLGYMGKHCEERNQCLPNPCKNSGNCYPTKAGFQCTCVRGYKGENCEAISKCIPNPCKNGGGCEEPVLVHEDYKCSCKPGYKGQNCQESDYCGFRNPCKNGGTCINGQNNFACRCRAGFVGRNCADIDVCHSNPCANGATCHSDGAGTFTCQCPTGFTGFTCEEKRSKCASFPCQNGGKCIDDARRGFHCECPPKYSGKFCQTIRNPCWLNPCQNNGRCVESSESYYCVCEPRYSGTTCEVFLGNGCNGCHSNAQCSYGKCVCITGYVGNGYTCEERHAPTPAPSKCHPNPCYNGGTCHEDGSSFTCECPKGYKGLTCKSVQMCLSRPCMNEGKCIEGKEDGDYSCKCKPGFKGVNCEEPTACDPNPCQNGATCLPREDGSYFCKCSKRYQGPLCELDKCSLCDVHAHCEDGKCVCDSGYVGEGTKGECLKPGASNPRFCTPNPCQNGGTCEELPNGRNCLCGSGFTGDSCEQAIGSRPPIEEPKKKPDPCSSNPCQHGGECIVKGDGFRCLCSTDYTGATCELPVGANRPNYCHPNPCLHGGTCIENERGFNCKCVGAYRGATCEVDDCDQCDIHAICVKGACRCRIGYKGDGFQCVKIKRCQSCSPYATCVNNQCICTPGYTGDGQVCQVPPIVSVCPAQCTTTCASSCPSHCCQFPVMANACPSGCSITSCAPSCPATCCFQPPPCSSGCSVINCGPSCPARCCRQTLPCPSGCSVTNCRPSCPSSCCKQTLSCPTNCNSNECLFGCPERCCRPCKPSCLDNCTPACPLRCCVPPHTTVPSSAPFVASTQSTLPSAAPFRDSNCPSHCGYECALSCPRQCCYNQERLYTQNGIGRTLKDNSENSSGRKAKLLSILASIPRKICPDECQTASCWYLCPAQCCGKTADLVKDLKRGKIARRPSS